MRPTVILEALSSSPHIQENTITDFKSRSKYWGSKGGLVSPKSRESIIVANRIVKQYYACPEYTITWRWREGKIDSFNHPISCGLFRCDTLVNYAYAFHPGYSLPTYNKIWSNPAAIYNYFPVESDLLMPDTSNLDIPTPPVNNNADNISSINKDNIKQINAEVFYQMLQNTQQISEDEIIRLWKLFSSNPIDNEVKILFYDYISFENPYYLTTEIINQAKNESGEARHKLLVILQSIYQSNLEKNSGVNLVKIANFFKYLTHQDLDKNDGGIVYRGIAALAPKNVDAKTANLTNMDKIHVNILNITKDKSKETEFVKNIIFNLDNPDDSLVVPASYQFFTELLINSNLKFFSEESKQLFKNHLENQKSLLAQGSMIYTSSYFEFKAALNANNIAEIAYLANSYVKQLNPDMREPILGILDDFKKENKILSEI